jgi:ABC-type glycerol-3-phosphate transport system substrate-binding protein
MTPWVEMARLVEKRVIQPWDDYIESGAMRDIVPTLRTEATTDGHLYSWPFLVDVTVQGCNAELVERAGLDPERAPASWDEYIGNARTVIRSGVAPFGCTFDPRGWRSLVPIAHSIGTDPYTEDGLFDFVHPASVEALEIMGRMVELANPDVLEPEAVLGSVNPDEAVFAAQNVAYLVKYNNAHVRYANAWPDPTRLRLGSLPAGDGPGGSVYWTTGIALLRHGRRKRAAAAYANALTHEEGVWRRSLGAGRDAAGQLPAFRSLPGWAGAGPTWLAPWVPDVVSALRTATPIRPHPLGEEQFKVARPYWEDYLRGGERSARRALGRALAAVREEAKRVSG